jgi:two-component system chemotaxis response regulator CheY
MNAPSKPRVLLIDDSIVTLKAHERFLAGSGFEVAGTARGGVAGINAYRELQPELVVLDIVMPDLDGVETLRGILEVDPDARVVMVSSLGTRNKVLECLEVGARSFLTKPYRQGEFIEALRTALQEQPA